MKLRVRPAVGSPPSKRPKYWKPLGALLLEIAVVLLPTLSHEPRGQSEKDSGAQSVKIHCETNISSLGCRLLIFGLPFSERGFTPRLRARLPG
jgi:hypothetical protein